MRFDVAFTFTRTSRHLIKPVAELLAAELGQDRILYDEFHQEELSTPRGGLALLEWYQRESTLVVVALSRDYDERGSWTYFEWPQVLGLIRGSAGDRSVLLLRTDDTLPHTIAGLGDMAFGFDVRALQPAGVMSAIMARLRRISADPGPAGSAGPARGAGPAALAAVDGGLARPGPAAPAAARPAELPADARGFSGRAQELVELRSAVRENAGAIVISGPAGVGKSAFATHAAHILSDEFHDGCLYINLQGATPGLLPVDPAEAVGRLLRSLGTAGPDIPTTLDEAAARYRTLLATRKVLVVLDNAASADQVRPLLSSTGHSFVVVTSRVALSALDGVAHLALDRLPLPDALDQLGRWLGAERLSQEPASARRLVELCDSLPLALRILGARLAARPKWTLQSVVDNLTDERHRLRELELADLGVRSSFEMSFGSIRARAGDQAEPQELLRSIGLLGAQLVSTKAVSVLADIDVPTARTALELLVDAQFLESVGIDRYRIHDLVRLFAYEKALAAYPERVRIDAVGRVVAFMVTQAASAGAAIQPVDPRRSETVDGPAPFTRAAAVEYMERELADLVAILTRATAESDRHDGYAARAADAAFWFCHLRAYPRELETLSSISLEAARRLGDRPAQAQNLHNLCIAYLRLEDGHRAIEAGRRALKIRSELNDSYGEGRTLDALGRAYRMTGQLQVALDHGLRSLETARRLEDAYSESNVLCNLVPTYLELAEVAEAVSCGEKSVAIRAALGDTYGVARMRMSLGAAYASVGRFADAVAEYRSSLDTFEAFGDRYDLARCLYRLGVVHASNGSPEAARQYLARAASVRRSMGDLFGAAQAERDLSRLDANPRALGASLEG